ncbi:hypothetical protein [Metallosphaera cuprina]|uniref:hypothetical protein n=1 Tax=Metallosphaera cuprina TaxID=1006005 RepID=UPI00064F7509|nr:hypothetical protein [Metallosphaera cuprina]
MICNVPKLTVTTWNSMQVVLVGPTYRRYLEKTLEAIKRKEIASIIGQPGMGKTTILKKAQAQSSGMTFFLDLSSRNDIEDEFWDKVDRTKIREIVRSSLNSKKAKLGYNFLKRIMGIKFESWLSQACGKYEEVDLRLYCLDYQRNFDGVLRFISDLKNFTDVNLMIDEVRDSHIPKIHRLINSGLGIPVIMAIPTDSYSKVTDLAIRRRLDESRISLDSMLTAEDIREIVDVYCHNLVEEFFPIVLSLWNGGELNTVSSILQYMKSQVESFQKECGEDLECIRERIKSSHSLNDPEGKSRDLEKQIRDLIASEAKELGITYVHSRGKRVEANGKSLVVGIFFLRGEEAFLGEVKLMNDDREEDEEVSLLSEVKFVEHERRKCNVSGRFVITNSSRLNVGNHIRKIEITTLEAVRVLHGDSEILREVIRPIFEGTLDEDRPAENLASPEAGEKV